MTARAPLAPAAQPTDWMADALCRHLNLSDMWFPERPGPTRESRDAIAVCQQCPVRVQCLDHALTNNERHGIWGGMTESERHAMRRTPTAVTVACRLCGQPAGRGGNMQRIYCSDACRKRAHQNRFGRGTA